MTEKQVQTTITIININYTIEYLYYQYTFRKSIKVAGGKGVPNSI